MEVQFEPVVQAKLERIARESGRGVSELVQDAVIGYVDQLAEMRNALDTRYDDIKSGRVKTISGDEVKAHFREKAAAARRSQAGS